MTEFCRNVSCKDPAASGPWKVIEKVTAITCTDAADFTSNDNLATIMLSNVASNVSKISISDTRYGNIKLQKTKQVDSETLAKCWNIDLGKAKKTVTQTTQHGVQICLHPTLGRQYLTNDQMLRYKHITDPVYADTFKSGIVYTQENKYGQAYCFRYGCIRFHPTAQKTEADDTLSLMFKCDGVPPKMIVDTSKKKSLLSFILKFREAEYHLVNNKPCSPWSQIAEACIRDIKLGTSI